MYTKNKIGERLIRLMDARKINQYELAAMIGNVQSSAAHYCSGRAVPSVDALCDICNALEVDADYFLKGD